MNVTIDIKALAIIAIAVAVVVLAVYVVMLLKKLMVTLEHTNKILEDVEVVSEIAANRSKDIDCLACSLWKVALSFARL